MEEEEEWTCMEEEEGENLLEGGEKHHLNPELSQPCLKHETPLDLLVKWAMFALCLFQNWPVQFQESQKIQETKD